MPPKTLADVKVDDEVVVYDSLYHHIVKVTKTTPTQIIVGNSKFRRETGRLVGETTWNRSKISLSEEDFKAARYQMAARGFEERLYTNQAGVIAKRKQCDAAERVLRERGEWADD